MDRREAKLKLFFFLTLNEWDLIDAFQNHVCAICKHPNKSGQRLSTDHSHITGLLRGLLCQRCNRILGKIEQMRFWGSRDVQVTIRLLRAAADFLEHPTASAALGREIYTYPGRFGTKAHRDWLKKFSAPSAGTYVHPNGRTDEQIRDSVSRKRPSTHHRKITVNRMSRLQAHR